MAPRIPVAPSVAPTAISEQNPGMKKALRLAVMAGGGPDRLVRPKGLEPLTF